MSEFSVLSVILSVVVPDAGMVAVMGMLLSRSTLERKRGYARITQRQVGSRWGGPTSRCVMRASYFVDAADSALPKFAWMRMSRYSPAVMGSYLPSGPAMTASRSAWAK